MQLRVRKGSERKKGEWDGRWVVWRAGLTEGEEAGEAGEEGEGGCR